MRSEPLLSVIIPIYNVEPYLRACVDSVLTQSYSNMEVILVDDGSPDGCGSICDEYEQKDYRVKVVHKSNGGLSDARNAGMAVAQGEYLMFVDSDDLLPVNAAGILMDIALKEKVALVIGGHARFEEEPAEVSAEPVQWHLMSREAAIEDMLRNGCAAWARVYHRELHDGILFPFGEINEDEAIVLQLYERLDKVAQTDTVVYHYRCRPQSITTNNFSVKKLAWKDHCAANLKYIQARYPQLERDAATRYRNSLLWSLTEIALSDQDFSHEVKQLRQELKAQRKLFRQIPFAYRQDRLRMEVLLHLPFGFYQKMLRLKRGS